MAQHDYIIANQSGAAFRADLNNSLAAIVSQNSGAAEPSTTYAYMPWADTANGLFKIRNAANSAWITLYQLDGEWSTLALENGTAAAPSLYFKGSGTDTGIYSPGADQVAISTGGTEALRLDSSGRLLVGTSTDRTGALLQVEGSASVARSSGGSFIVGTNYAAGIGVNTNNFLQLRNTGAATNNDYIADIRTSAGDGVEPGNSGFYVRVRHWNGSVYENRDVFNVRNNGNAAFVGKVTANDGYWGIDEVNFVSSNTEFSLLRSNNGAGIWGYKGASNNQGSLLFKTHSTQNAPTERMRIDSSGRLLVNTSSSVQNLLQGAIQVVGTDENSYITATRYSSDASSGPGIVLGRSKSATKGTNTIVANGDVLGAISFSGANGTSFDQAANITAFVDGTPGANDMPGRLVFSTTADGASAPTEQMRLTSAGLLQFNSGYGSVATAYGCRAWVNFNGTGTVAISGSGNVSSITDNGVGDYTVNFTTAMPDANYTVTGMGDLATGGSASNRQFFLNCYNAGTSRTSSLVRIASLALDATAIDSAINQIAIFR